MPALPFLGCLIRNRAYFNSWYSLYVTNYLEATEHKRPLKPKGNTNTDPQNPREYWSTCIQPAKTRKPLLSMYFQVLSTHLTPPVLLEVQCTSAPWFIQREQALLLLAELQAQSAGPCHAQHQAAPCLHLCTKSLPMSQHGKNSGASCKCMRQLLGTELNLLQSFFSAIVRPRMQLPIYHAFCQIHWGAEM